MDAALPPGPREPAALQTLEWVARPTAFLRRCAAAYGEAFTIRLAFDDAPLVLVWHPDAVRAVYAADPSVARRGASPGPLRPVAGPRSILFADGAEHLRIRRLMLASFHGERIAVGRSGKDRLEPRRGCPSDRGIANAMGGPAQPASPSSADDCWPGFTPHNPSVIPPRLLTSQSPPT
jgi:hypothetical protein